MAAVVNGSFASPLANAQYPPASSTLPTNGLFSKVYNGTSGFNLLLTVFLILVAYDQCEISSTI